MFVYGSPGSGKTYLASTLLQDKSLLPALILVCDSSELTLKDFISPDLDVYRADLDKITEAYNLIISPKNEYKCIFIDGLSNLHRLCMEHEAKTNQKEDLRRDYGTVRSQLLTVVDSFLNIKSNIPFIVTCWSQADNDESTGRRTISPNLPGKLSDELPGLFGINGYLYVKEPSLAELKLNPNAQPKRIMQVNPTREVPIAKNRGNYLGNEVIDPTIPKIKALIEKSNT